MQELRSWSQVPVLVLSARSAEAEKIAALEAGADDYLTKPFSTGELLCPRACPCCAAPRPCAMANRRLSILAMSRSTVPRRLVTRGVTGTPDRYRVPHPALPARQRGSCCHATASVDRGGGRPTSSAATICASTSRICARSSNRIRRAPVSSSPKPVSVTASCHPPTHLTERQRSHCRRIQFA